MPAPEAERAAKWYRTAIDYLPGYVKARVHLAEIYLDQGRTDDARALLAPALESGDPEVSWRLADVAQAAGDTGEAALHLAAARSGFEALLAKHPLAFADHGAEFYLGSGGDPARAFELAQLNLANRPTMRAFEQAHATAVAAGDSDAASEAARGCRRALGSHRQSCLTQWRRSRWAGPWNSLAGLPRQWQLRSPAFGALGLLLPAAAPAQTAGSDSVIYLDQAWSQADREFYYNVSQGSAVMDYAAFVNLEVAGSQELFRSDANSDRYGAITQAANPRTNPDGLPVGLAKWSVAEGRWKGEYIGLTCAACHNAQLHYKGKKIRVDGGVGNTFDFVAYIGALNNAMQATLGDTAKFDRLATRVGASSPEAKADLRKRVEGDREARQLLLLNRADGSHHCRPLSNGRHQRDRQSPDVDRAQYS